MENISTPISFEMSEISTPLIPNTPISTDNNNCSLPILNLKTQKIEFEEDSINIEDTFPKKNDEQTIKQDIFNKIDDIMNESKIEQEDNEKKEKSNEKENLENELIPEKSNIDNNKTRRLKFLSIIILSILVSFYNFDISPIFLFISIEIATSIPLFFEWKNNINFQNGLGIIEYLLFFSQIVFGIRQFIVDISYFYISLIIIDSLK
jgi:hypothetical protein